MEFQISIIIPVYNEEENIEAVLDEISIKIKTAHEILIVYDFEEDSTLPIVRKYAKSKPQIRLVKNIFGKGVLNAIKSGFEEAKHELLLVVMADLADDLSKTEDMIKKIREGYDLVCGSRYIKGGKQVGGPWIKGMLSRGAGISLYYLTGIPTHDVTNNFKMYRRKVLDSVKIESNGGFELAMEITVKAFLKGMKISEVPSIWRDRSAGSSKFRLWNWLPRYVYWYIFALKGRFCNSCLTSGKKE